MQMVPLSIEGTMSSNLSYIAKDNITFTTMLCSLLQSEVCEK